MYQNQMKVYISMKRIFLCLLCSLLMLTGLTSCAGGISDNGSLKVVSMIFPAYDWTRNIIGDADGISLELLLDSGTDLHRYQPTVDDIVAVSTCDIFICIGGPSDKWVDDVLRDANNPDMKVIRLTDVSGGVKTEEYIEGMEHSHDDCGEECEHGEEDHDHAVHDHEHTTDEIDEHVWLSLRCAANACAAIADTLCSADPEHADTYRENCAAYTDKLNTLDVRYAETLSGAKYNTLLFGDRFPFRYLVDDYEVDYYAAFTGCSSETEASFETVAFLANKLDELKLTHVMTIEGSDASLARTIIQNSTDKSRGVLTLDSMQSVTREEAENGADYIKIMEDNLKVLETALCGK